MTLVDGWLLRVIAGSNNTNGVEQPLGLMDTAGPWEIIGFDEEYPGVL